MGLVCRSVIGSGVDLVQSYDQARGGVGVKLCGNLTYLSTAC